MVKTRFDSLGVAYFGKDNAGVGYYKEATGSFGFESVACPSTDGLHFAKLELFSLAHGINLDEEGENI